MCDISRCSPSWNHLISDQTAGFATRAPRRITWKYADMRSTVKRVGVLLATLVMITSCGGNDHPADPVKTSAAPGLSQSEVTDIATEAYAYAYPLVTMDVTRKHFTNTDKGFGRGPMNVFHNVPIYPPATDKSVVTPMHNAVRLIVQLIEERNRLKTFGRNWEDAMECEG